MNIYDIYIIAVKNTTLHILPESSLQKQGFTNPRLAVSCFQGWPPGVTNHSVCDEVQARGRLLKVILSWLGAVQILEAYNSLQQWIPDWLDFKLFFFSVGCFRLLQVAFFWMVGLYTLFNFFSSPHPFCLQAPFERIGHRLRFANSWRPQTRHWAMDW